MIITDRLVFINYPKTGSTFVRAVLRKLYLQQRRRPKNLGHLVRLIADRNSDKFIELQLPNLHTTLASGRVIKDQHGCFDQIPEKFKHLPIVTIARHPFDRYVSMYKFRWWADNPCENLSEIHKYFPGFPRLTFAEFIAYHRFRYKALTEKYNLVGKIGPHTLQFVLMHFKEHDAILRRWSDSCILNGAYKENLPKIEFLRTENLNEDLYNLLLRYGFLKDQIEFIRLEGRIQPPEGTSRTPADHWSNYFSDELIDEVAAEEFALFKIYKDFGICYATDSSA